MSLSQPTPPDPSQVSNAQQGYNIEAATQQAEMNNVNQQTPYGSLSYTQSGTNPDGTPKYTATTQLSPEEQGLFNATSERSSKSQMTRGLWPRTLLRR